jgi:hypothetical protein
MSVYQCPKCELRFTWHTELDDHCRVDHPDFHHEYPVAAVEPEPAEVTPPVVAADPGRSSALLATWWSER